MREREGRFVERDLVPYFPVTPTSGSWVSIGRQKGDGRGGDGWLTLCAFCHDCDFMRIEWEGWLFDVLPSMFFCERIVVDSPILPVTA